MKIYIQTLYLAALLLASPAHAAGLIWAVDTSLTETRYAESVARNPDGTIHRRGDVLRAFQRLHPCPSTGLQAGACPHWAMNHNLPLACGGRDAVDNLSWVREEFKTGFADDGGVSRPMGYMHINPDGSMTFVDMSRYATDRVERKIYDRVPEVPGTDACTNAVIP